MSSLQRIYGMQIYHSSLQAKVCVDDLKLQGLCQSHPRTHLAHKYFWSISHWWLTQCLKPVSSLFSITEWKNAPSTGSVNISCFKACCHQDTWFACDLSFPTSTKETTKVLNNENARIQHYTIVYHYKMVHNFQFLQICHLLNNIKYKNRETRELLWHPNVRAVLEFI